MIKSPTIESRPVRDIEPSGHRILVEIEKIDRHKKSMIIIPDKVAEKMQAAVAYAKVLKLGPTAYDSFRTNDETGDWCKKGDTVLIAKYGGAAIPNSERLRVINDEDVIGVATKIEIENEAEENG